MSRFGYKVFVMILFAGIRCVPCFAQQAPVPDQALLARFEAVCEKMTVIKGDYTLAGIMNITDKTEPGADMKNVAFLFCKKGDEFYYQLGMTATINENAGYLYIDYKTKTVMLGPKKEMVYDDGFSKFGDLGKQLTGERYRMTDKVQGGNETITLLNEQHISCKLYAVTFDKKSLKVNHLHMRLSNQNDPLRTDNEKVVDMRISKWENSADLSKYPSKNKVVKNAGSRWVTINEFKNYRLVKM